MTKKEELSYKPWIILIAALTVIALSSFLIEKAGMFHATYDANSANVEEGFIDAFFSNDSKALELDKEDYDRRMFALANNPVSSNATSSTSTPPVKTLWPAANDVYPKAGALLPFKRIIAYYGNFYSKQMGVLGEYPEDEMIAKLRAEQAKWEQADPNTPTIPAIHYIAITAQGSPAPLGKYIIRMPEDQIQNAIRIADKVQGIAFLDLQVGLSNIQTELPLLEKYLALPNVHLGLDPEFAMRSGDLPGKVIGTYDATDINFAIDTLARLVKENNLPPKVLVVHRFTQMMMTNYQNIKKVPEVQVVIDMDGWGSPSRKFGTYYSIVADEPVQFTGFKLFYKNDLKQEPFRMLTPAELMTLNPRPIYIQYQ